MNSRKLSSMFLIAVILEAMMAVAQEQPAVPKTKTDPVTETLHGVAITDPYRWLEDQKSPQTRAWIDEQNRYTQSMLGRFPGREQISKRLGQLLKIDTIGVPVARGERYFFTKRLATQNQPVIYMRLAGKDQVLIDPNTLSPDQTTSTFISDISEDGKLLLYGVRQGGEDEATIKVLDVDTRRDLPDQLSRGRYFGISLKPDNSGFYYSRFTAEGSRVYYHAMGSDTAGDKKIFGDGYGPTQIIGAGLSEDGRYLNLQVNHGSSGDKVDVFFQDLEHNGPISPVVKGVDAGFGGDIVGDSMFLQTNWNAPNWRIVEVDLKNPATGRWKTIIPESSSAVIDGFSLVGGKMFVTFLENVSSRTSVYDLTGKRIRDIQFPTIGSSNGVNGRWKSDEGFYSFDSFAQPRSIYRYQVSTGKQELWARINVPVQSDQIEVKQVWYESKDKARIPMYLVQKKGMVADGKRPTLLTGYGGFNVSLTPTFSARAAFWVENGGVFAQPNLRGGGEFGEKWHKAGMLANKQNVFDDFIAAGEWLIKNRYTNPDKLAIEGGSNGGLLVGAAMTQRPELFRAVVCSYPLLDMVRYHQFLVARFWVPEYGSSEDAKQFDYIRKYSPYHNIKVGTKYPAALFITGDADTRVDPLHARKMTALVQASTGSDRPVLLHYDVKAGHSGGLPVSKVIEDLSDEMCFLFWQLGATTN
jgi:prolyl oligopeptidase